MELSPVQSARVKYTRLTYVFSLDSKLFNFKTIETALQNTHEYVVQAERANERRSNTRRGNHTAYSITP